MFSPEIELDPQRKWPVLSERYFKHETIHIILLLVVTYYYSLLSTAKIKVKYSRKSLSELVLQLN